MVASTKPSRTTSLSPAPHLDPGPLYHSKHCLRALITIQSVRGFQNLALAALGHSQKLFDFDNRPGTQEVTIYYTGNDRQH